MCSLNIVAPPELLKQLLLNCSSSRATEYCSSSRATETIVTELLLTCYWHVFDMILKSYWHVTDMLLTYYWHVIDMLLTCYWYVTDILSGCEFHEINHDRKTVTVERIDISSTTSLIHPSIASRLSAPNISTQIKTDNIEFWREKVKVWHLSEFKISILF